MATTDNRIDAYIAKARPFARPILTSLRETVHAACPDVEETMKWSFPHFDYKGMMCSMAAFKEHAVFGFWKAALMKDPKKVMESTGQNSAMGHFGRLQSVKDLPPRSVLKQYIREAMKLNDAGVIERREPKPAKKPVRIPADLAAAFTKNARARVTYAAFPPGQKREYIEWLTEAKTPETRARRLKTAVGWMAEGKPKNWKYMKKY